MSFSKPIGERMKEYEFVTRNKLIRHIPTIIRLDGKAFHTFTRKFERPFSYSLHNAMCVSMQFAMRKVMQNAVLGYTQSDEISILLKDWPDVNTEQWFNGNIQKITSVAASVVTASFNDALEYSHMAFFDARVFQLPINEVTNYFIWRQQDASRNSVQMLGHQYFSQKEMHGLNNSQVQDKLMLELGINWNDIEVWKKRGSCCHKDLGFKFSPEIPIFTQDRDYIERLLVESDE